MLCFAIVIGRAGASPPSRTNSMIFLYIYIYIYIFIYIRSTVRRALNLLRASFFPIFQYFSAVNVTRVSFSPVFQYFVTYIRTYVYTLYIRMPCATELFDVRHAPWILLFFLPFPRACAPRGKNGWLARLGFFGPEGRVLNKGRRDSERRLAYRDRPRARRGSETATQRKLD